jgi:hypothetical protein
LQGGGGFGFGEGVEEAHCGFSLAGIGVGG